MSKSQAHRLRDAIERYWSELGFNVNPRVVPTDDGFGIETDLVNGLPPDVSGDELARRREQALREARARTARPI